jgi:hypothetical protein
MNKSTMALFLGAAVALTASPFAMAQSTAPTSSNSMQALPEGQVQPLGSQPAKQGPPRPGDRSCLQSTGSMIPAKHGGCLTVPGRSYSRQDIQNTGETTMGPALQKLDPSVTIQGGH